jgi:hypothetical protein
MKKTKFNPELLKEELKRFNQMEGYQWYAENQEPVAYEKPLLIDKKLEEEDEVPTDLEPADDAAASIGAELGVDDTAPADAEAPAEPADSVPPVEPAPAMPAEPATDDVEIDVTSLVKGSEEAKMAADKASQNSEMLLQKLTDLESRIAKMDMVSAKIEELENEIIKRNPTDVEKLEMRSLSSFPYSQKLTDYWADKEGQYDVMNGEEKKKEYVLTQDDVDADFSEPQIKKSFGASPEEFDEEDM